MKSRVQFVLTWQRILIGSALAFALPSCLFRMLTNQTLIAYLSDLIFVLYAVIAILLFARATVVTRRYRPALFRSWLLLTAAVVSSLLTVGAWILVELIMQQRGDASTGALFLLISHLLSWWGIYCFPKNRQGLLQGIRHTISLLTVLIGATLLLWLFWINPLLTRAQLDLHSVLVTTIYLLCNLVLIATLTALLFRQQLSQPRGPLAFLGVSILMMLFADVSLSLLAEAHTYQAGDITDLLYLAALILGAAAAALQTVVIAQPTTQFPPTIRLQRLLDVVRIAIPPLLLSVTATVMIFTFDQHAFYGTFFLVGGVGTMFILVSVHQVLTLLENAELTTALHAELTERQQIQDELEQVNALLEQHVVARTKELLVLNEQLVDNERKLRFDAFHDKLTGLPNRAAFIQHLESALQAFRLDPTYRFGVLFLDFDGFKVVNDSLGHWLGDEFLIALARRLKELLPIGNLAARLGGDEFVVLIENILDEQEVLEIAERIQCELRQPFDLRGYRLYTSASIGIVMNDQHHQTAGDLLRDADIAMYQAKENGKDCCIVFGAAMRAQAMARLKLETALRNALARQELTLAYQPIWNVATQQITGFEALARWHHAEHGLIPPTEFIPIAEETGLIIPLGDWILEEACRQLNAWQTQLPQATALTVSVNISAQQLYQGDLPGMVQQILERTGLSARSLKLEITESIFMEDVEAAIGACTRLQDLGVCLQIDDFGTGYSSFNYLHRLPINTLKIDKSFIDLLNLGGRHVEIVRTIATLAHNLQLTVIAEGVETEAQLTYVEALGCEQVQGYLISKPLTAHAAEGFIQSALVSLAPPPLLFSPPSANHAPSPLHATVTVAH